MRSLLRGYAAHAKRAARLAESCVRLFYCPRCQHPYELDADVAKRPTVCRGCKETVTLSEEALDELQVLGSGADQAALQRLKGEIEQVRGKLEAGIAERTLGRSCLGRARLRRHRAVT